METAFENILEIPKIDKSVQGSIREQSVHDQSIQMSDAGQRVKTQNDRSIQNSRVLPPKDKSMQYQPSMLS